MRRKRYLNIVCLLILVLTACSTEKNIQFIGNPDVFIDSEYARKYDINASSPSTFPELYFGGVEVLAEMLELIEKAENYIVIDTFLIVNDIYGRVVLDSLIKKHSEGVEIYVMADFTSNFLKSESGIEYLKDHNISCVEFNPIKMPGILLDPVNLFYRNHNKYWIIDGKYLFVGGCNIINTSLKSISENGNTDIMVLINSPGIIEQLLKTFVINWNRYSLEFISIDDFYINTDYETDVNVILFNQNDPESIRVIEFMMSILFNFVEKEIWLIQPYTFVDKRILSYITYMKNRNIEINIILSGFVNHEKYHYASFYGIKDLIDAGVNVWIYERKSPLHCKAFIIDDKIFSIGSANFNKRSMERANEVNLIFYDDESVRKLKRFFLEIEKYIRKVSPEEALKYRKIKYRYWHWMVKFTG